MTHTAIQGQDGIRDQRDQSCRVAPTVYITSRWKISDASIHKCLIYIGLKNNENKTYCKNLSVLHSSGVSMNAISQNKIGNMYKSMKF